MKAPAAILSLAVCLLFPSCVRWHLGAAIRDAVDVRVGVDVEHPVGGKVYMRELPAKPNGLLEREYYAHAPEVSYHQSTPWVEFDDAPGEPPLARPAVRVRPTGRVVLARFKHERERWRGLEHKLLHVQKPSRATYCEEVSAPPPGATLTLREPREDAPAPTVASLGTREHRRSLTAAIVAAPFDYVVDPVLSSVSTVLFWTGAAVVGGCTCGVFSLADWCQQQQQQPVPSTPAPGAATPSP